MTRKPADADPERRELADLRDVERLLRSVPAEVLIDGAPHDADLLLQRTLRAVRTGD